MTILSLDSMALGATAVDPTDAIRQAGELLVKAGRVDSQYVDGMLAREATMSTYLGNGVAIPHGTHESITHIKQTGISVVQIPAGVTWEDDEVAYLVIGIASSSDDHMEILSNLAEVLEEEDQVMVLAQTSDPTVIMRALSGEASDSGD